MTKSEFKRLFTQDPVMLLEKFNQMETITIKAELDLLNSLSLIGNTSDLYSKIYDLRKEKTEHLKTIIKDYK